MAPAWQLRRANLADLSAIMPLETATFGTDAWSTDSMAAELASPHTYYLVAFQPGTPDAVDGYAGLLAPSGAAEGDVQTIAVAEGARRQGLGRALLASLVSEAGRRGASEVFLEVRADNPGAEHLYTAFGFERLAVRRGYYQPDNVDAIVMRLIVPSAATSATASGGES
jgi:ribosomal-protein-alanine acetyltransferase